MSFRKTLRGFLVRTASDGDVASPPSQVSVLNNRAKDPLGDEFGRFWMRQAGAPWEFTPKRLDWFDTTSGGTNGLVTSFVIGFPTTLVQLHATNSAQGNRFILLFNATGVPINGTKPLMTFPLPANGSLSVDLSNRDDFTAGVAAVVSTTITPLTITLANEVFISIGVER